MFLILFLFGFIELPVAQFATPAKSTPLPSIQALEQATWRKNTISSAKSSSMPLMGSRHAVMPTPRWKLPRTAARDDSLRAEKIPPAFMGPDMTIIQPSNSEDETEDPVIGWPNLKQELSVQSVRP